MDAVLKENERLKRENINLTTEVEKLRGMQKSFYNLELEKENEELKLKLEKYRKDRIACLEFLNIP